MKKILITGINSYIGNQFKVWCKQNHSDEIIVESISLRSKEWENADFRTYDSILHLAAIVHKKETKESRNDYYKVNKDLTIKLAEKAKREGVKQFVFFSTMSVYGKISGEINLNTATQPITYYGKSKKEAEDHLKLLSDMRFKVAIVRPPMIYGKNAKGNFNKLLELNKLTPFFPDIKNRRSMIYIENLLDFTTKIIMNEESGIFYPQNEEFISTSNMFKEISLNRRKSMLFTNKFNYVIIFLLKYKNSVVGKMFGDLYYEKKLSHYKENYNKVDFSSSIRKSI